MVEKKITLDVTVENAVSLYENNAISEEQAQNVLNQFNKKDLIDYMLNLETEEEVEEETEEDQDEPENGKKEEDQDDDDLDLDL